MLRKKESCPCCGNYTIPISNSDNLHNIGFICPVCFWEIDVFIKSDDDYSSSNHITLKEARENYIAFGACDKNMVKNVRKPTAKERK